MYEIPEWMMNNFTSWLSEFDNDSPYYLINVEIGFEEAKARYRNTLRKVCEANVIEFADLLLICDLAYLICSPVQNSHYPPCDVSRTLYQEYKNRMGQ
jgi:hypothetical protein